jgi:ketosteroid isomerase-like protein
MNQALGAQFAKAVAAKDAPGVLDVLAPDVDFKAMTPGRFWEAESAQEFVDAILFGRWIDDNDHVEALEDVQTGEVGGRGRVLYRLRVVNLTGTWLVEQQAYFDVEDDRISWLRIMCSGFRKVDQPEG